MKKYIAPLALLIAIITSCVHPQKTKEISQQDNFIELVSQRIDSINSCVSSNPIQTEKNKSKKILYSKQFFNTISKYSDSILIFRNWFGTVDNFEYIKKEKSSFVLLDIEISYKGNKDICYPNNKITLKCIYNIDNKSKDKDAVFNNMSTINNNSNIYIEGFINRSMNGHISVGKNLNEFNFTILNISTMPINDSISVKLNEAINLKFEEMKIFGRGVLQNKDEKEIKKESAYLKMDSIINTLSSSEIQYIKRIEQSYVTNIAREYVDKY